MLAEVQSLAAARLARWPGPGADARAQTAAAYVGRAEDALELLGVTEDATSRAAIVYVTETWLSLAESQLSSR